MASQDPTPEFRLERDPFGRLRLLRPGGEGVENVFPVRCFPFTAPDERISICDDRGHEVLFVEHLDAIPAETAAFLRQELHRREFIPIIHRIRSISEGPEPTTWHVETDRGETRFLLTSDDHIRRLGAEGEGALIADSNGVRYRVLDSRRLDARSRRLLGRYL